MELQDIREAFYESERELRLFNRAKALDDKLLDKSKNGEMNEMIKFYASFFDEESGNDREQGIKKVQDYLTGEAQSKTAIYVREKARVFTMDTVIDLHIKDMQDQAVKARYMSEENERKRKREEYEEEFKRKRMTLEKKNIFLPIIPIYNPIIFHLFFTILAFSISFGLIPFDLSCINLYIPEFAIPTIISNFILFI